MLGIYIHWPFCEKKCPYCDFFSHVENIDQDKLVEKYLQDLDKYFELTKDRKIGSIFFGGGTPSLIKPQNIEKIINHIHKKWSVNMDIEITLEANPNSLKAKELRQAGINRLSLGVQSLNDEDLRFLGRIHNRKGALKAIEDVLANFDNHSMDLIYARPNQALQAWKQELEEASNFGFKHLSLYQLSVEEGTPFHKNGIKPMNEDKALELYNFTNDFLNRQEYGHYEISNYAQKGFESKHNLCYWQGWDYLGIGQGAHGRLHLDKLYAIDSGKTEELTPAERAEELLIMGLRIKEGINKQNFQTQCGLSFDKFINRKNLQELKNQGLITEDDKTLKPTPQGLPLLNKIIEDLS